MAMYLVEPYPFSYELCKFHLIIDWVAVVASVNTVCLISWDRYMMVQQAAQYNQTQTMKAAFYRSLCGWIWSFLSTGPAILFWDFGREVEFSTTGCVAEFVYNIPYTIFITLVTFVVPFLSIGYFNIKIILFIRRRQAVGSVTQPSHNVVQPSHRATQPSHQVFQPSHQVNDPGHTTQRNVDKSKKAAKSLLVLILVYVMCWLPYSILAIIVAICPTGCVSGKFFFDSYWILYANSLFNPIIYGATNKLFLNNYKRLWCRLCRGNCSS